MICNMQQVPDEFERVLVGIQSYISIRRHFDDIAFSVFETDEGNSPNKKVNIHCFSLSTQTPLVISRSMLLKLVLAGFHRRFMGAYSSSFSQWVEG
jgi:hypothetical protein